MKRKSALCALLSLLLLLCGCIVPFRLPVLGQTPQSSLSVEQTAKIQALLLARQQGVNRRDSALFLSTVSPDDACLYKEESSLIRSAQNLDIADFSLSLSLAAPSAQGFTATLQQSYTLNGIKHRCSYNASFTFTNEKLYYSGPVFSNIRTGNVSVYFAKSKQTLAQKLLSVETDVLASMKNIYGYSPSEPVVIKIYDDLQVFVQSVKFDLPEWVGGWHEYKEAIKLYDGGSSYGLQSESEYFRLLRHETTHLMLSELSFDNAAYWLQEGMAGISETALGGSSAPYMTKGELTDTFTPFATHKKINLEDFGEDDVANVRLYYATSKAYAAFLLDAYGWETMKSALVSMQSHPYLAITSEEKLAQCTQYTDEMLGQSYGFSSDAAFQSAFAAWLAKQRK